MKIKDSPKGKKAATPKKNTLDSFISIKSKKEELKISPSTELDTSNEITEKRNKRKRIFKEEPKDEETTDSANKITKKIKWDLDDDSSSSCNTVKNNINSFESMSIDTKESKNSKTEADTTGKSKNRRKRVLSDEIKRFPDNPFPEVFQGKTLGFYPDLISFSETERDKFERHWIAYGGKVVKSVRNRDVDYLVHATNEIDLKDLLKLKAIVNHNVRHVNKNWIEDCIKDVVLHISTKYPVFVAE